MERPTKIASPRGKLGVLMARMGAVSTTFMAGVELIRTGRAKPIGSLTQLGTVRLGKREARNPGMVKCLFQISYVRPQSLS
jgi:myo-inositol-1-phosphate synthase